MFCVSMLISAYVLHRLTYFSVFLTRKSGRAPISAVSQILEGGQLPNAGHGGALPVRLRPQRSRPTSPARAHPSSAQNGTPPAPHAADARGVSVHAELPIPERSVVALIYSCSGASPTPHLHAYFPLHTPLLRPASQAPTSLHAWRSTDPFCFTYALTACPVPACRLSSWAGGPSSETATYLAPSLSCRAPSLPAPSLPAHSSFNHHPRCLATCLLPSCHLSPSVRCLCAISTASPSLPIASDTLKCGRPGHFGSFLALRCLVPVFTLWSWRSAPRPRRQSLLPRSDTLKCGIPDRFGVFLEPCRNCFVKPGSGAIFVLQGTIASGTIASGTQLL